MPNNEDVQYFKKDDREEYHEDVRKYKDGMDQAPQKSY